MKGKAHSTPDAPAVLSDRLAVVYDRQSGAIVHLHRVTTLAGAKIRSDEQLVSAALEHAGKAIAGFDRTRVQVLIIEPDAIKPGHIHSVDVERRVLLQRPNPSPVA